MYELVDADFVKGISDYKKCDICPPEAENLNGIYVNPHGDGIICECKRNWKLLKRVERLLKESGIPTLFWNFNLPKEYKNVDKALPEIITFISNYKKAVEAGINLYLYGDKFTYKTRVAAYIGKMMMYFGYSVSYLTYVDCYTYIEKHRFSKEEEFAEDIHLLPLFNSQFLILDDLPQMQLKSDSYPDKMIVSILKNRVQCCKNNIYISRFAPKDLVFSEDLKQIILNRTKTVHFEKQFVDNAVENFFG